MGRTRTYLRARFVDTAANSPRAPEVSKVTFSPGSCERAAELTARRLLEIGATNLEAKLGAHIASFGERCWQTDERVRNALRRSDGRRYHRESIARARRHMRKIGWLESERVFPNETPQGAKYRSTFGTTTKSIRWGALGLKNPLAKSVQRRRRLEQERQEWEARTAARYLEPELAAMVAGMGRVPMSSEKPRGRLTLCETTPRPVPGSSRGHLRRMTAAEIDAAIGVKPELDELDDALADVEIGALLASRERDSPT